MSICLRFLVYNYRTPVMTMNDDNENKFIVKAEQQLHLT